MLTLLFAGLWLWKGKVMMSWLRGLWRRGGPVVKAWLGGRTRRVAPRRRPAVAL
jgi:hypothetical protein